jgi:hypothetical protein
VYAPPVQFPPDQQEETIEALVSQFGGGEVQVKIYKQLPGGIESYWYTAAPDQVDEERIRAANGGHGGQFVLKIMAGGEFRKSIPMNLSDAPGSLGITPGAAGGNDAVLQMMLNRMTTLETLLLAKNNNGALAEREPMSEMVAALKHMHEMTSSQQPKEMPVDTLLKCIELGKSIGAQPSDDWKTILLEVLREVAPVAGPLLASMARGNGANGTEKPSLPDASPEVQQMEKQKQLEANLKAGIAYLKKKCMIGADPGLYIDFISDNVDIEEYAQLVHIATTQDFSVFASVDAELEQPAYQSFFRSIYDGLRFNFIKPDSVAGDTGGKGGNGGDTAKNVGTGKGKSKPG